MRDQGVLGLLPADGREAQGRPVGICARRGRSAPITTAIFG